MPSHHHNRHFTSSPDLHEFDSDVMEVEDLYDYGQSEPFNIGDIFVHDFNDSNFIQVEFEQLDEAEFYQEGVENEEPQVKIQENAQHLVKLEDQYQEYDQEAQEEVEKIEEKEQKTEVKSYEREDFKGNLVKIQSKWEIENQKIQQIEAQIKQGFRKTRGRRSAHHYQDSMFLINSLKQISFSVCNFVQLRRSVHYPNLMRDFVKENPEFQHNIKRRMYDVINVLCSAKILSKNGDYVSKFQMDNKIVRANKEILFSSKGRQGSINILKLKIKQKQAQILKKRAVLEQLNRAKRNLERIQNRNIKLSLKVPDECKIFFPFICYIPKQNVLCSVNSNTAKIMQFRKKHLSLSSCVFTGERALNKLNFNPVRNFKCKKFDDSQKSPPGINTPYSHESQIKVVNTILIDHSFQN